MKIKVGIFFGGPSREREISFAGGRTVFDNLNKSIFEPLPIFVDSHKRFIALEWPYIYKGTIRDFFPPVSALPVSPNAFQVYLESLGELEDHQLQHLIEKVGRLIDPAELANQIDVAFLALHGEYGEDGTLQAELEDLGIPYTGSGVEASKIGIDKALQKGLMQEKGFSQPAMQVVHRNDWKEQSPDELYQTAIEQIGFPMVIRPTRQGSSIGVSIIDEAGGLQAFEDAINQAFFRELLVADDWQAKTDAQRVAYIRQLSDLRDGLGFPIDVAFGEEVTTIYHPEQLLDWLNDHCQSKEASGQLLVLESHHSEEAVLLEGFIDGKEFSCIVVRHEDGNVTALPPTEIRKGKEVFDYRSKYLPGRSRKVTPIALPIEQINAIRQECERLFTDLNFQVYARIDGFITADGTVLLNDPNTTSGMLPSSFFFHQAAEIGLNPSEFLTFIIRISLQERLASWSTPEPLTALIDQLDTAIASAKESAQKRAIGVILGGYSFERHISVESGRNIYEKLSSSEHYHPIPIFLTGTPESHTFYQLPINLLLKDNADDIRDKILNDKRDHPVVEDIKQQCLSITAKYGSPEVIFHPEELSWEQLADRVDGVFIALHGRPGEDGQLQMELEARNIPYNGSGIQSSSITIDKYKTLQLLRQHGFSVADQLLLKAGDYQKDTVEFFDRIESRYRYPFVAKPVDDGCSSAVRVIRSRKELEAYTRLMFRPAGQDGAEARRILGLSLTEEFPQKGEILFENLIGQDGAEHFLEVTGGLLTHIDPNGVVRYEVFEPSETLTSGEVLTLEEKFLAGEGQNITPARFSKNEAGARLIAGQVRSDLEKAARILQVEGYARIDAFVRIHPNNKAETIIIEVNSLPGMTPATCIFHQAAISDYKPSEFIEQILEFSFLRQQFKDKQSATSATPPITEAPEAPALTTPPAAPVPEPIPAPQPEANIPVSPQPMGSPGPKRVGILQYFGEGLKGGFGMILKNIWRFLTSGIFIRNLIAIIAVVGILFYLTQQWLQMYTNHGESLEVENYEGLALETAIRKAERRSFEIFINDSIYIVDRQPNIVLEQDPPSGSRVKENRRIYLTVTKSTPPEVLLPNLVESGYDYFQYAKKLEALDLKPRIKERQFNKKLAENQILHFFYDGKKITDQDLRDGIKIPKGSILEFVITRRFLDQVPIPNLVCKKYDAASFLITSNNLVIGEVIGNVADVRNAYIWKQTPAYNAGEMVATGSAITIYVQASRPSGCRAELDPSDLDDNSSEEDNQDQN
jgi:UDP-N-acetylmuramate--alanine ligase